MVRVKALEAFIVLVFFLGTIGLTAFVFYLSGSGWSFLILILLIGLSYTSDDSFETTCPQCGCEFLTKKHSHEEKD